MKNSLKKGFTLIELLVVVAIIGILAAVVLASLNSARSKSNDAAIKEELTNMRAQAQLYYMAVGNDYTGLCGWSINPSQESINDQQGFMNMYNHAYVLADTGDPDYPPTQYCNANDTGWMVVMSFRSDPLKLWCVDGDGSSEQITVAQFVGGVSCP